MRSWAKLSALSFAMRGSQASDGLPDNGTPQCEYAHTDLMKELQNAEEEHLQYKQSDKIMDIAIDKANWYSCRNCKSGYLELYHDVENNDQEFQAQIHSYITGDKVLDEQGFQEMNGLLDTNREELQEMRDVWEEFRRQSSQERNAVNSIQLRYRYYDDTQADLTEAHASYEQLLVDCQPLEKPPEKPVQPEDIPEEKPADQPSETPSEQPSEDQDNQPSEETPDTPDEQPSEEPSETPDEQPSEEPSETPDEGPSEEPSETPDEQPSEEPAEEPSEETSGSSDSSEPVDPATHDGDQDGTPDAEDETCECPSVSDEARQKLEPLIINQIQEDFILSQSNFADAVVTAQNAIQAIITELYGEECHAFCSASKLTINNIGEFSTDYANKIEEMTAGSLDYSVLYLHAKDNIIDAYREEKLEWFKHYYNELEQRTQKKLDAMYNPNAEEEQQADIQKVKREAAAFEYNTNFEAAKIYLAEAHDFIELLTASEPMEE